MSCVCCYENFHPLVTCECGEKSCHSCIRAGTTVAISSFKKLFCLGGCKREIHIDVLATILNHKVLDKYNDVSMSIDMSKMGITGENVTQVDEETLKLVIRCCGVIFVRGDACNKVSCPVCHVKYCWVCKEVIEDYRHFETGRCEIYGEREAILKRISEKMSVAMNNYWDEVFNVIIRLRNELPVVFPQPPRNVDFDLLIEPIIYLMVNMRDTFGYKIGESRIQEVIDEARNKSITDCYYFIYKWYGEFINGTTICKGVKKNGVACSYKTKTLYCKIHAKQALQ